MTARANKAIDLCRRIAAHSEEQGRVLRMSFSPTMQDVHALLRTWMETLGMQVHIDSADNLHGVLNPDHPRRLILASHLDTVPDAGAFDGILGVVLGILLVEEGAPSFGVEVIGFANEEGVCGRQPFLGSNAASLHPASCAYLEFHIEQGPVLESLDLPLGIVESIAGQSRYTVQFNGSANHAGTTPMHLRRDALAAAAEWILVVERESATVGRIVASPNAVNVVPGRVITGLDVRNADNGERQSACERIVRSARDIAARRHVEVDVTQNIDQQAVPMDPYVIALLEKSVRQTGHPVHRMISGAGHDAMILAPRIPTGMLFLRSPGGVSHHPDETVLPQDVEAAIETGLCFLRGFERV